MEWLHSDRCQLIVVGLDTGGRWSGEAAEFICQLAGSRAREALLILRGFAFCGWRRWTSLIELDGREEVGPSRTSWPGPTRVGPKLAGPNSARALAPRRSRVYWCISGA